MVFDQVLHRTVTNTENKNIWTTLNAIEDTLATKADELRDLLTTFTNTKKVKVYTTQEAYNIFDKAGLIKQSSKHDDGTILCKELASIEGEGNAHW